MLEETSGVGDLLSEAESGQPAYGLTATPLYTRALTEADISRIFQVTASTSDIQYENTLTIHRESQANRQLFQYIGVGLGLGGNRLKKVVINPAEPAMCSELESMLGSSSALEKFLSETVKVNPTVAQVTARQWGARVSEVSAGISYVYGFAPFLEGKLCSRNRIGSCYAADPKMTSRLDQVVPGFLSKTSFNCHEIAKAVNVLASMPAVEPLDFSKPLALPYDQTSLNLTADELFDFFIALGNALTNQPGATATFADTLPQSDLDALNNSGISNPENQMTSQTNIYFMNRFVGR